MNEKRSADEQENRDPITGAPGAHPVGTGIGAAGGGAAGAAIGTAVGGPIGAGIGIVAGAIAGGLVGKGTAEAIDPTAENAYWRENYRNREYVDKDASFETYQPAYRVGYEGYGRHRGRSYHEVEAELQRDYERTVGRTGLAWDKARHATRDAWNRVDRPVETTNVQPGQTGQTGSNCGCS